MTLNQAARKLEKLTGRPANKLRERIIRAGHNKRKAEILGVSHDGQKVYYVTAR